MTGAEEQTIEFGDGYAELKATATDLVDGDLTGSIAIAGTVNTDRVGQYTVTYDVSDTAGNAAVQKTRTVIVEDTMKPGITVPEPYATEATATLTPLGRDEYGIATSTDGDITDDAPATFPVGDTIITWTATDTNDLISTAEQTITIADTTKPDITAPANVSTEATGPTTSVTVGQAAATDLADNALKITRSPETNDFAVGEHAITWKATDASGNEETDTQTITIADTTAPEITLTGAEEQTIEFGDGYAELKATATDLVDGDLTGSIAIAGTVNTDRVGQYTVTYDVSDTAGNAAVQKTRTVIVEDTMKPGITAPEPYATEATATLTPLGRDEYGIATSTDGDITDDAPATFPVGDTIITWTATDANDLSSTAEQTITIADTTKPDITAPANVSTEATGPTTSVAVGQAAATDLADQAPEITRSPETNDFAVGEHAITWKATDASGNEETDTQTITIADTTAPEITLTGAEEQTIEFGDGYAELKATATDLVDGDLTGSIAIAGTVNTDRVGQYTVTYDVSDTAGNAAVQKTRTVIVEDTMKPGITAPEPYATEATATLTPLGRDEYGIATSTDGDITDDAPEDFPVGDTIITWTATDANDLSSTAEQTITIADTTKPVITAPEDVSKEATGPTTPVAVGQATATDLADNALKITRSPETNDFAVGEHAITWKATDASGNEETDTQTITIADTTAPEITLTGAEEQTIEFGDGYAELKATATDLVDGDLTGSIAIAGTVNTDRVGQYTVTYDVSDTAGNAAVQKTRTVIVEDTMKPGITAPEPYATEATATLTPLGRDEYGIATSTDGDITDDAPATFPVGDTIITWTATDANDLISTAEQTITIADTTKPDITAPANVSTEATGPTTPVAVGQAAATDLADQAPKITRSPETNDFAVGEHAITWKATDASGNEETDTQTIAIADTTAPEITLTGAEEQTIEFGDGYAELKATATDLVDGDLTGSIAIAGTVNTDRVGQYTVTYDVSDTAGNAAVRKTRTVIVEDTMKPGITAPEPYATEATATLTPLGRDEYGIATSTDGDITDDAPEDFPVGDTIITWTATDTNDLISTAEQTITIADTTKPDITAPANVSTEATGPTTSVTVGQAAATDLADQAPKITRSPETNNFAVGEHTITWTATDASGNVATAEQAIAIADTTAPEITLAGTNPQTIEFGEGYAELKATATDAVDDDTELTGRIAINTDNVDTSAVGTYTVTYDVTDIAGNAAVQKTRTVRVTDITALVITAPAPYTTEAAATLTPLDSSDYGTATSNDPDADITNDAPGTFPLGDTTITWTATDSNHLSSSAEQTITVVDTTKPIITLLKDTTDDNTVELGTAYTEHRATATDLVDDDTELTGRIVIAGIVNTDRVGTYTVTYDVSDTNGNPAEQKTRRVMVTAAQIAPDNIPLTIIAPADVVSEATGPTTPIDVGQATATDLATPLPGITRSPATNDFAVGNHIITWKVTDASGNEATIEQTIRITDTTKPMIALLKDTVDDNPVELGTTYTEHGATATDLVDDDTELTGKIAIDSTSVNTDRVGTYTVTYDVTDNAGNHAEQKPRTVIVEDTTAPEITVSDDETFEATATLTPLDSSDYGTATSTDGTATISSDAPETFPVGETIITWTATDPAGNKETDTQIITVVDTTKPVITLSKDTTDDNRVEFGTAYTEHGATATDLVDDDAALTERIVIDSTNVNTDRVGEYSVTYDVSDAKGNAAATVTRRVIVEDTIPPDIVAPLAQTFEATATMTPLNRSDYGTATSSDPGAVLTDNAPATFPMGETMITWTATDTNELSSSAQQMITVMDTTPPNITLLGDNPLTLEVGGRYIEPGATAVDDMAGDLTDSIVIDATDLDTNQVGTYTVTYTVADHMGNEAQESRSVQVLAGPDFADLNRMILSEVARAMADQNVHAIAQRLKQAGGKTARIASLGGQSSLEGIIAAQGQALADDQFNIKRFLADSDFVLPLGISEDASDGASDNTSEGVSEEASRLTFWGSGDYRSISDSDQLTWDGDLFSLHLGLDTQVGANLIAGVSLSWNQVALDYSNYTSTQTPDRAGRTATSGDYALEMASIHPYVGWNLGRLDLWATLGYGEGELDITDDEAPLARHLSSDLNLQTLALGASGPLLAADSLRVKAEALRTELEVVGNEQLAALSLDVSRLRMTLEATGNWSLDSGAQLGLILEGGLRYDGGAGKTGSGTEMGGGLRYVHAAKDLTLEAKARSLANYKGGIEEWGLSGLIKFQGSADGRGLFFSLMPAYGEAASSNLQQLWRQGLRLEDGDTERPDYAPSLDLRFGYGMTAPGGRGLLTPYSEMTFGDSSGTYRLGLIWQFNPLDVKLVTERREGLDATAHSILLEGTITF